MHHLIDPATGCSPRHVHSVTILANDEPMLMAPNPTKAFTLVFKRLAASVQESLKYAEFDLARYKTIPNANRGRGQAIRRIREAREKLQAIAAEKKAVLAWVKAGME